jgi:hypothetical protein
MSRIPANVTGDLVRVALMEARPAGLSTRQLVTATEMSAYQVQSGLRFLREVLAAENLTPLTWTRAEGYRLSTDPADWIAYERACVRTELTRLARLLSSTVIPHAQKLPDDEWVQLVLGQLTGVKSALGLLVRSA